MSEYFLDVCVLKDRDQSDPLNELVIIGIKISPNPRGSEDEIWGTKLTVRRDDILPMYMGKFSSTHILYNVEEVAVAALVKFLVASPPPPHVQEMIRKSAIRAGGALAQDWSDITKGVPVAEQRI